MSLGLKVAQTGVNVATAADYQLVINSKWPMLTILAQGAFTSNANSTIYEHDLGYSPAFILFRTDGVDSRACGSSFSPFTSMIKMNNNKLYQDSTNVTIQGYFYIFKQDLTAVIQPTFDHTTAQISSNTQGFGIKVAQDGFSVNSGNLVSSSAEHPMVIHMMGPTTTSSNGTTLVHNLGYYPVFLLYALASDNGYYLVPVRATADIVGITFRGVQAALPSQVNYIVLKDPLFS